MHEDQEDKEAECIQHQLLGGTYGTAGCPHWHADGSPASGKGSSGAGAAPPNTTLLRDLCYSAAGSWALRTVAGIWFGALLVGAASEVFSLRVQLC